MLALGARHSFGETLPLERIVGCLFAHLQTLAAAQSLQLLQYRPHSRNLPLNLIASLIAGLGLMLAAFDLYSTSVQGLL